MRKYHGKVGYVQTEETIPGIFESIDIERNYFGNVIKNRYNIQQNGNINGDIQLKISISILADPFAYENATNIRYVTYLGKKWQVVDINIDRPRIELFLGGLYNG